MGFHSHTTQIFGLLKKSNIGSLVGMLFHSFAFWQNGCQKVSCQAQGNFLGTLGYSKVELDDITLPQNMSFALVFLLLKFQS
jgi:hypothetical protein